MRQFLKIALFVFAGFLIACSGLNEKQKNIANEALIALNKINAATQIGVNYQTYNQLLIDAKAKTNEVEKNLSESKLKTELLEAMKIYEMAGRDWNDSISMDPKSIPEVDLKYDKLKSIQKNWQPASQHLAEASKLIE